MEPRSCRGQLEFLQNLLESDYVLCARGYGNYSHRLYEALACGRIPLFIDTDCVLPFDFAIDWKRFCVWVDQVDLRSVADRVAEFHASISGEEFEELQVACRRLWEEWLSPEAFFANFHRHLDVMGGDLAVHRERDPTGWKWWRGSCQGLRAVDRACRS